MEFWSNTNMVVAISVTHANIARHTGRPNLASDPPVTGYRIKWNSNGVS